MSPDPTPHIAITAGDPRGVGLELMLQALGKDPPPAHYTLIAPPQLVESMIEKLPHPKPRIKSIRKGDVPNGTVNLLPCAEEVELEDVGKLNQETSARIALASLAKAIELAVGGRFNAIVTAPLSKSAINRLLPGFVGQTEYLAERSGTGEPTMLFWRPQLSLALVTRHLPLSRVADALTTDAITRTTLALTELLQAMGEPSPRIAVCALNPHAGEDGILGDEEGEIISPAIEALQRRGMEVTGPLPADSLFARIKPGEYHGVTAMYHDQGLIFFKSLGPAVNVTWELPFVRTSPDHGPAFDLAGSGDADVESTKMAIKLAVDLVKGGGGKG